VCVEREREMDEARGTPSPSSPLLQSPSPWLATSAPQDDESPQSDSLSASDRCVWRYSIVREEILCVCVCVSVCE
jgi:hypothetical protein